MFILDIIAIFPFDELLKSDTGHMNAMIRLTKIGRLQKLIKLTRLLRLFRVFKMQKNLINVPTDIFKLGSGIQRILFYVFMALLVCHISACLWIFFAHFAGEDTQKWLDDETYKEMKDEDIYLTSFYFIITTFSTVGYGDISASNPVEKIFCILIMIIGVTAFAAGTSEMTNLL